MEQIKLTNIEEGNKLVLHRNIRVVDDEGNELMRFPEFLTKPRTERSDKFLIEDINEEEFQISLKNPPTFKRGLPACPEVESMLQDSDLSEIKKYASTNGYTHDPHW